MIEKGYLMNRRIHRVGAHWTFQQLMHTAGRSSTTARRYLAPY
jgi:hypothetical protein